MDARELPAAFFARFDPGPDAGFYAAPRLVTHIDDGAIAAVGELYEELGQASMATRRCRLQHHGRGRSRNDLRRAR